MTFQRLGSGIVLAATGWLGGCGVDDDVPNATGPEETATEALHWSYEGERGPAHWGALGAEFATCASGQQQSPIDIPAAIAPGPLRGLELDYAPGPATLSNNGHTLQVDLTAGANVLNLDGEPYALLQFHFHARSEHAVGGQYSPLEMHLVHRAGSGALAVIGVFFEAGSAHAALSAVFEGMSAASAAPEPLAADVDPAELLPPSLDGWTYSGSLTTPPCTEGVRWHLLSTALQISEAQLQRFTALHEVSYRPVMPNTSAVTGGD